MPLLAILDVEAIVQHVGLKCLKRASDHLPPVLGPLESTKGGVPGCLEEVLFALIEAMIDLPDSVHMLQDD